MMWIRLILLFLLGLLVVPLWAKKLEVVSIVNFGERAKRSNLVFLAEGYTKSEREKFLSDVRSLMEEVNSRDLFRNYTTFTNIYAIPVQSTSSGISTPSKKVNTYFGGYVGHEDLEQFMWIKREDRVCDVLADNFPDFDQVVVLINTPQYGGGGGEFSVISTHPKSADLLIHELGHSFAKLSDEYWVSEEYAHENVNMSQHKMVDSLAHGWQEWHGLNFVSIYNFDESTEWNRPHQNCIMRSLGNSYCPVCRQAMVESMQKLVHPSVGNTHQYLSRGNLHDSTQINFTLNTIEPIRFTTDWAFDGIYDSNKSVDCYTATLASNEIEIGTHTLQAKQYNGSYLAPSDRVKGKLFHTVSWLVKKESECLKVEESLYSTISILPKKERTLEIVVQLKERTLVAVTLESKEGSILWQKTISSNSVESIRLPEHKDHATLKFWKDKHCFADCNVKANRER